MLNATGGAMLARGLLSLLALGLLACSPEADSPAAGQPLDVADTAKAPTCHPTRLQPGSTCCPVGEFFVPDQGVCAPIGPPECKTSLLTNPSDCWPRWCWTAQTAAGESCAPGAEGCKWDGRVCTSEELASGAGCDAGMWPGPTGKCVRPGLASQADQWTEAGDPPPVPPLPPLKAPSGVPQLEALPPLADTRFCVDSQTQKTRICLKDELGCGEGQMADPDDPKACIQVGVSWTCPPGFIADGVAPRQPDVLPGCKPDPEACGSEPWDTGSSSAEVVYVDAAAATGGDGSLKKPLRTITEGLAVVAGAAGQPVVAVAAGTYKEALLIDSPVAIRGRCAQKVILQGPLALETLKVHGASSPQPVLLRGLTVRGGMAGVWVSASLKARLEQVWVHKAGSVGVVTLGPAARAEVVDTVVADTLRQGSFMGVGIVAASGGQMTLNRVRSSGNGVAGVLAMHAGSVIDASELVSDANLAEVKGKTGGFGAGAYKGARVNLRSARVSGNKSSGLQVVDANSRIMAVATVVDGTLTQPVDNVGGFGVSVGGGRLEMTGCRLSGNLAAAIQVAGVGASFMGLGLIVEKTDSVAKKRLIEGKLKHVHEGGGALNVVDGAAAAISSARFSANMGVAASIRGKGSLCVADGLLVDGTRATPKGHDGVGMYVAEGARVVIKGARLSGNRMQGLMCNGKGSRLEAEHLLIDGTLTIMDSLAGGRGLSVTEGAIAALHDVRLSGNRETGMYVGGAGTFVDATDLLVDGTLPTKSNQGVGRGVEINFGAKARLHRSRISASTYMALMVDMEGTEVEVSELLVDGTFGTTSPPSGGYGIGIRESARFVIRGSRLSGNRAAGIVAPEGAALVEAAGLLIDGTLAEAAGGLLGMGAFVGDDSRMNLLGSMVRTNQMAGLVCNGNLKKNAQMRAVGSVVEHTLASPNGRFGMGVMAINEGAGVVLLSSAVRHNRGAGLLINRTSLQLRNSLIADTVVGLFSKIVGETPVGDPVDYADGLMIREGREVLVEASLIRNLARAGMVATKTPKMVVKSTFVTGSVYGLVSEEVEEAEVQTSLFWGNQTNVATDAGLSVPSPPQTEVSVLSH